MRTRRCRWREAEALATMQLPPVPTLCLHGADDDAIGPDLHGDLNPHFPIDGSTPVAT